MIQSKLTVTIQLDACRNDYIDENKTPFLYSIKQRGISGSLVPTFGYEPDAAYLAGLWPDQSNSGMHFWYTPIASPIRNANIITPPFDLLPKIFKRIVRMILNRYIQKTTTFSRPRYVTSTARIPFKLIPFFDLAEKHLLYEDKFANGRSIFSALKNSKKSFFFHGAPTCPTRPEDIFKKLVETNHPVDFIFLHTGILDQVGHKFGPFSQEIISALRSLDGVMNKIWDFLKKKYGDFNFLIMGDHGMVEVKEIVNIEDRIKIMDLKLGKDYIYFLDSTLARFWFFNEKSKRLITTYLNEIKQGHILTDKDKKRYHLNYSHNKFGDIIFLVDPGVLIFPNFWNNTIAERGMHGYDPEYGGQQSALIINTHYNDTEIKLEDPIDMRKIFPTLLKLAGLRDNKDLDVNSII